MEEVRQIVITTFSGEELYSDTTGDFFEKFRGTWLKVNPMEGEPYLLNLRGVSKIEWYDPEIHKA